MQTTLLLPGALIPAIWLSDATLRQSLTESPLWRLLKPLRIVSRRHYPAKPNTVLHVLPHEQWLATVFNQPKPDQMFALTQVLDLPERIAKQASDPLWRIDPVFLSLATDHIKLGNARLNDLSMAQAQALIRELDPALEAAGAQIFIGTPQRWYLSWPSLGALNTSSAAIALGRSVQIYQPTNGATDELDVARQWRRFASEVEMTWFQSPVNQQRSQSELLAANALWLQAKPERLLSLAPSPFAKVDSDDDLALALQACSVKTVTHNQLLCRHALLSARMNADAWEWAQALAQIDGAALNAIEQTITQGGNTIELILTGEQSCTRLLLGARKPWHWFSANISTNDWQDA
jgi:hypothetical protein